MKKSSLRNKYLFFILLIVLILVLSLLIYQQKNNTSEKIENNNNAEIKTEIIDENIDKNKLSLEEQEHISSYLENNISELSPEKEVLGGKFFITSLDFLSDEKLVIEYEDGHIALKAEVDFKYLNQADIVVENFKIINQ